MGPKVQFWFLTANSDAFIPVKLILEITRFALPVFVTVMLGGVEANEVPPIGMVGKLTPLVLRRILGAGITPTPVKVMPCGGPALLDTAIFAVRVPAAVGSKVTRNSQLAPGATTAENGVQDPDTANSAAAVPVIDAELSTRLAVP
jgi:hypothetical protein